MSLPAYALGCLVLSNGWANISLPLIWQSVGFPLARCKSSLCPILRPLADHSLCAVQSHYNRNGENIKDEQAESAGLRLEGGEDQVGEVIHRVVDHRS